MPARLPVVDALKGIASQLIVLHHLAFYGPMSDVVSPFLGGVVGWLSTNGRIAVQVFLVMGGYMAARALAPHGRASFGSPLSVMIRRYLRLSVPYAIAIGVAIVAAALAADNLTGILAPVANEHHVGLAAAASRPPASPSSVAT